MTALSEDPQKDYLMSDFSFEQASESAIKLRGNSRIPGPASGLFWSQTRRFHRAQATLLTEAHRDYGDVFQLRLYGKPTVVLVGPEAAQWLLSDREEMFSSELGWAPQRDLFTQTLLRQDFGEHREMRKVVQQGFKAEALRQYEEVASRQIIKSLANDDLFSGKWDYQTSQQLAMQTTLAMFLGREDFTLAELKAYCDDFSTLLLASSARSKRLIPGSLYRRGHSAHSRLKHNLQTFAAVSTSPLLEAFAAAVEEGVEFSPADAIQQLLLVILGAHNNGATLMSCLLWVLGQDLHWQQHLRDLIHADAEVELQQSLEWTIKETLRLYPPIANIPRYATSDSVFSGYRIKEGKYVLLSPWLNHRLPEYWSNPQQFDPERFSPARAEDKHHRFLWLPFGGGAHKCLGIHVAMFLGNLFLKQFLTCYEVTAPAGELPLNLMPTLHPKAPFKLSIKRWSR